ncbi:AUGMIN subunit 4 [Nymphaea thermarum]|nr:AUGMIN subunit 4 [Nymphaea thermarum]
MAKVSAGQSLPPDIVQLIEQLDRHCLAPDGSLVSRSAYYDLQLAREEMSRERLRYLEAMAVYCEAIAMVEEYQQAVAVASLGGIRDVQGLYFQLGLKASPQVYETLEHRLLVAEASQRLRLPLLSKDGQVCKEEIEKCIITSRNSLDTSSSSTNTLANTSSSGAASTTLPLSSSDNIEDTIGGIPNRFLGITPSYLQQCQLNLHNDPVDTAEHQMLLAQEMEARLNSKCDKVSDAFAMEEIDCAVVSQFQSSRLPERVKFIIEEIEREEAALRDDLYSADRKFAEYYNVLEQILGVLIRLVKDLKLQQQHQYDELKKTWLCKRCETMNAKLRVLENLVLRDTYTQDSIPALHKIRQYLLEATEEASTAYNKAKLEGLQWTIHQVEMDLKRSSDHPAM